MSRGENECRSSSTNAVRRLAAPILTAAVSVSGCRTYNECSMSVGTRMRLRNPSAALHADLKRIAALWSEGLDRHGGPFLGGARFTAVDAFFAPVATRIQTYGLAVPAPAAAYATRLLQHEAVREWVDAGVKETFRDEPHEQGCRAVADLLQDLRA